MIQNMFEEAIKYPFNDFKKVIILGAVFFVFAILFGLASFLFMFEDLWIIATSIFLFSILIYLIFSFGLLGYEYRIINFSLNKADVLPEFNDFSSMFVDGLKYFLATFIYSLVAGLIQLVFTFIYSFIVLSVGFEDFALILGVFLGIGIFIVYALMVIFLFIGIPNMIKHNGSISKALDVSEIWGLISKIGVGRYLLLLILVALFIGGIFFVISLLTTIFSFIPVIGLIFNLVLIFLVPYFMFFSGRIMGSIYNLSQE